MASKHNPPTIGHYSLSHTIGKGTFGKVKLGMHTLTGEKVAVKILEKARIKEAADSERVSREIHILRKVRHPNIVQLYEIIETSKQIYLVMEYASGGELFDHIVSQTRINEREACRFFQQIVCGVEYTHRLCIAHRDLKPENLLLSYDRQIKVVDFGLSNTYKTGDTLKTGCGSPCYAAPEMIAGKRYLGMRVDIWSMGVVLYTMICGYLPFEDPNTSLLYRKILNCEYSLPKFISPGARDLIKHILISDPDSRYTITQIKAHSWYKQMAQSLSPGLVIGSNQIPVDVNILGKLGEYGIEPEHAQRCVEANKHNNDTTTYYLLLKRHIETGGTSNADVLANHFVPMLLVPRPPDKLFERKEVGPVRRRFIEGESKINSTGGTVEQEVVQVISPELERINARRSSTPGQSLFKGSSDSPQPKAVPGQLRMVRGRICFSTHQESKSGPQPPTEPAKQVRRHRPQTQAAVRIPMRPTDLSVDSRPPSSLNASMRHNAQLEAMSRRGVSVRGSRPRR
jgi:5'-AMP-activated protein kinase catalytic alpha subunit